MAIEAGDVQAAQAALADELDPPGDPAMRAATRLHLARVILGRVAGTLLAGAPMVGAPITGASMAGDGDGA